MSLFGTSATADAAGDVNPEAQRRKLLIAACAGVALIAVAAYFLLPVILGGSSSSSAGTSSPLPRRAASVPATPSPTPTTAFVLAPADVKGDPFAPLPEEAAAAAAAAASAPATAPPAAVPSTSPAPSGSTAAAPSSAATTSSNATTSSTATTSSATASTNNTPATGKSVQVVSVNGASADIQIDGKSYKVKAGTTPVSPYAVKSVGNGKVTIARDGTPHTLTEGELQTF